MSIGLYRGIGIVGAGRVARALALALAPFSRAPLRLWARDAGRLALACEGLAVVPAASLEALAVGCHLLVIAVADDAMPEVVARLAAVPCAAPRLVCHVSGRSGAALLAPLQGKAGAVAAIHPAMTFTGDPQAEVARMKGARFAITAPDAAALDAARALVACLGGVAVEVAEAHRALYHAALCHGANHLVTLMAGAFGALAAAGVEEPAALLAPLVRAALENSLDRGFAALSGPLLRGDRQTVDGHLQALERDCPALLPAYQAMALATVDRLEAEGAADTAALRQLLAG